MTTQVRINVLTKSYPHKKFCLRIKQFKNPFDCIHSCNSITNKCHCHKNICDRRKLNYLN